MKFSSASVLAILLSATLLGGCASKQPERRLTMPNWFDGYGEDEPEQKARESETPEGEAYAAESAADASDRIQTDGPAVAGTESVESTETAAPLEEDKTASDTDSASDADTTAAAEQVEPEIKRPPQPEPLTAKNEQQALEAQQARPRFEAALERMQAGELEAALVLFQEISAQFPSLAGPVVNQAIILRSQEKYDQAKSVLQSALLNKAQNPYLMVELGLVHRQLGNFEAAKQSYLSAIRMEPNYDKAHYNLAVLADLYLHDPALAFEEFSIYQSLQVEPDKKVAGWLKEIERRIP